MNEESVENPVEPVVINRYPNGRDFVAVCGDSLSMRVLKRAYRKHVQGDESIGWEEISDELANVLAQTMGDDEFCRWLEGL